MVKIKPFKGYRPTKELAKQVAALPYDVINSEEAKVLTENNPHSFLRITKPEVAFDASVDSHSNQVYQKGKEQLDTFISEGILCQDDKPCYYIYRQIMNGRGQTGLVVTSAIDDYFDEKIKKHEYTRHDKEQDRIHHMETLGAHPGPVFLTYKKQTEISQIITSFQKNNEPHTDFVAEDEIQHTVWKIDNEQLTNQLTELFSKNIDFTYIADGHHRSAASAKVGKKLRDNGGNAEANYNYFLSVLFPDEELAIMDYNRVIKDLNGLSEDAFLEKLREHFEVESKGETIFKPNTLHEFSLYLGKNWYRLVAKKHTFENTDEVGVLDISVLSKYALDPILGIKDQRKDTRIDFVGGIRGLKELKRRVDSGEMKLAFAFYPVSVQQLIDIADAGQIMPPKSTWFEPKLRSGLIVHKFN